MSESKTSLRSRSRSTVDGLIALMYHLVHATSQGQIDPALARDLGRNVCREIEGFIDTNSPGTLDTERLAEAVLRLDKTLMDAQSSMLLDTIRAVRQQTP